MKRLAAILLTVICVAPAIAQQPDPVAVVAQALDLSDDQITAWSEILQAARRQSNRWPSRRGRGSRQSAARLPAAIPIRWSSAAR